jgi:transcriptional regulator with XRE-family HTH domain
VTEVTEGEKIQKLRKEKGLTQAELAKKSGLSEISIRKYENNDRKPKLETIRKIAIALDVYMNELIENWSNFSQAEIIRDMADEDNQYFWTAYLEDKLRQVGCKLVHDEDNYQTWIEFPDGAQEVTDSQLKELDNSTIDFINFKLDELRKKYPNDFRQSNKKEIKWSSTVQRLNTDSGKK